MIRKSGRAVFRLIMERNAGAAELSVGFGQRTAMVEKLITSPDTPLPNVVSLSLYRERNGLARAMPLSPRVCSSMPAVSSTR